MTAISKHTQRTLFNLSSNHSVQMEEEDQLTRTETHKHFMSQSFFFLINPVYKDDFLQWLLEKINYQAQPIIRVQLTNALSVKKPVFT